MFYIIIYPSVQNFSPFIFVFNKLIIDVIEAHKNNEIDRWIPVISEYRRVDLDQLNEFEICEWKTVEIGGIR